jgi:hypothetical protein
LRRRVEQDKAAVQAGLTLPINNGQVEGQVTKIKLIKRMMDGRAEFPRLASAGLSCPLTRLHDEKDFFGHTAAVEFWPPSRGEMVLPDLTSSQLFKPINSSCLSKGWHV